AFLAAGCSSSNKSSAPSTTSAGVASPTSAVGAATPTTAAAAAGSNASTIKIGYICSCTGPLASSIDVNKKAYQAWVAATNAAGGINGHKIQLFTEDDAFNPATSVSQIHTLVEQDHVIAIASVS